MSYFQAYRPNAFPNVVKNIIILNVLAYLMTNILYGQGVDLVTFFGLYHIRSDHFMPFQFISYMFMHGGFMHILFNMYGVWMFGRMIENIWGSKRFLIFYIATGIGAAALHILISEIRLYPIIEAWNNYMLSPGYESFEVFVLNYVPGSYKKVFYDLLTQWSANKHDANFIDYSISLGNSLISNIQNIPMVGASGAVFGILTAFAMIFPNTELYLLFIPFPIKAKYLAIGYGAVELYMGVSNSPADNVAHFAHLGGMLVGFILVKIWNKKRNTFY